MNEKKICIIICTNNEIKLSECIHYLNHVIIPDGYELNFLAIEEAKSIVDGYNEGMTSSDAKYKIYMHQDTLILNKNILLDLLSIFESDKTIGMIGMTGYKTISEDGMMWHAPDRVGNPYVPSKASEYPSLQNYRYDLKKDGVSLAALVDGFFLATCVDLEWKTGNIKGWDFYDAYKSIQMLENGYKVVVPNQLHPWCLHDDGFVLYLKNYNTPRLQFISDYAEYLGKSWDEIIRNDL